MPPSNPPGEPATGPPPPASTAITVLVVESDPIIGEFMRHSLETMGAVVLLASTPDRTLRELRQRARVILVVDDDLPLVRGLDLLGRAREERRDVEAVLLTSDDAVISMVSRLRVDKVQCLKKPFQLEELKVAIGRALDRTSWFPPTGGPSAEAALGADVIGTDGGPTDSRPSGSDAPPAPNDGQGLRVLIVDDDPVVRRSLARSFRGHRVATAENGKAATAEIERSKPDIIFSDLRMPEMDGLELAREVATRWPDLKERIVFVSGTDSHIERAKSVAPEQPLLRKPVSSRELEERMNEVLEAATRRPPRP